MTEVVFDTPHMIRDFGTLALVELMELRGRCLRKIMFGTLTTEERSVHFSESVENAWLTWRIMPCDEWRTRQIFAVAAEPCFIMPDFDDLRMGLEMLIFSMSGAELDETGVWSIGGEIVSMIDDEKLEMINGDRQLERCFDKVRELLYLNSKGNVPHFDASAFLNESSAPATIQQENPDRGRLIGLLISLALIAITFLITHSQ